MRMTFNNQSVIYGSFIALFIYLIWPTRFASHYPSISRDDIYNSLIRKTTKNVTVTSGASIRCDYTDLLKENRVMYKMPYTEDVLGDSNIKLGGEFAPTSCTPSFSTAILVVYRNREEHLKKFLAYMHNFLRAQQIHYRIFVIEQYDSKPFNRAKLFNIGAHYAMKLDFPCLVLHDVDLMPMRLGQLYACTAKPRHMCSSLDQFRYHLPYYGLFGGVVAIDTNIFQFINGMSNMFQGWGGEDDDLYGRLVAKNIEICRFEQTYSLYTMLRHAPETPNADRLAFLRDGPTRYHSDGLNSLVFKEVAFKLTKYYTHILVET